MFCGVTFRTLHLYEQYPASEAEALLPRTLNKRMAPQWLQQCYQDSSRSPICRPQIFPVSQRAACCGKPDARLGVALVTFHRMYEPPCP
jgi:hypothetical protein